VPATATFGDALGVLRMNGLRASSARRMLLEAIFAAEEPRSAERLAIDLDGDLASVYRNLETLERVGLVRHFHLVHGPGLYTLAARERDYLVCERCGAIRPVPRGALDDLREAVRTRFGLLARFSHYPLVGLCEECV
jgi:Fur family ferric uptake transcriptional regulator